MNRYSVMGVLLLAAFYTTAISLANSTWFAVKTVDATSYHWAVLIAWILAGLLGTVLMAVGLARWDADRPTPAVVRTTHYRHITGYGA